MSNELRQKNSGTSRARRIRIAGTVCALVASAALLTGCGDNDSKTSASSASGASVPKEKAAPSDSPSGSASLTEDQQERKKLLGVTKVTYDKAADTALAKVSGGKLTELDLEGVDDDDRDGRDDNDDDDGSASPSASASASGSPSASASARSGNPQWVAEVAEKDGTVHKVHIDAVSGKVISSDPDKDQDADDKRELAGWLAKAKKTPQDAAKTATDKKKGTVTSVSLDDTDSGSLVWSVDVVTDDWNKTDFDVDAVKGDITREHVDRD
ncbi:PepSY domain-containing protein [Streptomyces sp. NPDC048518]|uniref:PepSY domain-containing protein n=1 Tax=Streptomyces sp. NPDC048518 TaxID=3155029 RepID=UPI0033FFABA7